MIDENFTSYEQVINQLIYQNRMLTSSRNYRLGKRILLMITLLKQGKLKELYGVLKNKCFFMRMHKQFDDLPTTTLADPGQQIPLINVPAKTT